MSLESQAKNSITKENEAKNNLLKENISQRHFKEVISTETFSQKYYFKSRQNI